MPQIGRVSSVAGPVQYQSIVGEWSAALANEPVAAGTGLRAAQNAETELRGPGTRVALAPSSELHLLRFDGEALQIAVLNGRIGVRLDENAPQTVEIDLPHGGVWLDAPGDYDITAGDVHDPVRVEVFAGAVRLGGGLYDRYIAATERDWFSDWWRAQDDNADLSARPSTDIAGAAALDAAGSWESDSKLGKIWYPSDVAADWTPDRDGVWRFLAPWGWTWIADEPWGFAPAHYGRWARIDDRWGWVPGVQVSAADYSPATVAFLGTVGIGLSRPSDAGPAVAWFPLGPGETIGDGNDANYRNRAFATAVPRAAFAGGLPAATAQIDDVPRQRFADAPVILDQLGIAPAATVVVAAAPKRPGVVIAAAAKTTPISPAPIATTGRQGVVVALRAAPAPARGTHKRLRIAIMLRSHPVASTSALRWTHNRRHLAAARGGA
jgi:hypothetical protein